MAEKELTPWRPFTELSSLRREMDRLWENFFGETAKVSSKLFSVYRNADVNKHHSFSHFFFF